MTDIDDYQKSMATASDITSSVTGLFRGLGSAVRNMGLAMTVASGVAGGAMVALSNKAARVNEAFREVQTISSAVSDTQEEYGQLVSDLNTEFGLQADKLEVIEGLYQSVSAGVSEGAESQREFMETAAELSVVGLTDLSTSVDVLSTMINAYGEDTEFANRASEALFRTVQFGKTRLDELAPVMGRVTALGAEMGINIEELGTSMAVLTRTGFESRVAATGLRNVIRTFMRPGEQMQEVLRDIALEQDLFADSMEEGEEQVSQIASEYREATEALANFESQQQEARQTQEDASLAIQEARLKIQAIEEERLDQLPELTSSQVEEADSIKELESVIDDYQFTVNKARIEEENARQQSADLESQISDLRAEFKEEIDAAGDLEGGIGQLVVQNEGLIDTLTSIQSRAQESGIAMSELFPRTRSLQAALALVGEDGELLTQIFQQMRNDGGDVEQIWEDNEGKLSKYWDTQDEFITQMENLNQMNMSELYDDMSGGTQDLRDATSELSEAATDLGNVFSEDVIDTIGNFTDMVTNITDKAASMEDSMRENISQFMILAVSIGLVLGPLLFFGGQLAIIASTVGSALIPVLASGIGLLSLLGSSLYAASQGGEEADSALGQMQGVLGNLVGFLTFLKTTINREVVPGFLHLGHSINVVLSQISSDMGGEDMMSVLRTQVVDLARGFGVLMIALGDFLAKNKEMISQGLLSLVEIISSNLIPNLIDLAKGILDVITSINPKPFIAMAMGLGQLLLIGLDVLGWIGRFMSRHQDLLGTIVTVAGVVISFALVLGKLAPVFSAISSAAVGLGMVIGAVVTPGMTVLGSVVIPALSVAFSTLVGWFAAVVPAGSAIVTGFGYIIAAAKILIGIIGTVVSVIGAFPIVVGIALAVAAALIWKFRDEIAAALKSAWKWFVDLAVDLKNWAVNLGSNFKTWGENLIQSFINGMNNKVSGLKNTVKGLADTVKGYLGFGSSPPELGKDFNPENYGENVGSSFAEGIEGMDTEVASSSEVLADSAVPSDDPVDFKPNEMGLPQGAKDQLGSFRGGSGGMGMGQDITIEEKAVFFAKGAFQGVSDEELPRKVRDEVDRSMDDIIEDLEGAGRDSISRT